MSLLVAVARASLHSETMCHIGASSGTLTLGSASSQPSTTRYYCLSTRRAMMAMCMIISQSRATTVTLWPAPSTIAPVAP
jgi:hypothetical protein